MIKETKKKIVDDSKAIYFGDDASLEWEKKSNKSKTNEQSIV